MTAVAPSSMRVTETAPAETAPPRIVDPLQHDAWDALVATYPAATFFHSRAWAQTLASTYNFQCRYVVAEQDGQLGGLLPIMETHSWLRGTRAVSLPFTDECRAPTSRSVSFESLLAAATLEAGSRGWKTLGMSVDSQAAFHGVQPTHYTHQLQLGATREQLFDGMDSAVRRAIRKAERSEVSVRFATDLDSTQEYYRLHCRTRTRLGSPPQPFRFFAAICEHILQKGHGFIALAMHRGRAIAGAVFFHFGGSAVYKFSASDERFQELRPANLVIWKSIERLLATDTHQLSFGRTSLRNDGLRRFKLGWGAQETTICRGQYNFDTGAFSPMADLADGLHTRLFAALPVFISRWIGFLAYPHLN